MAVRQSHDVYQAIADPARRKILQMLANEEYSIKAISKHFEFTRTAVVKHLNVLEEARLVKPRKSGREKIYSLQPDELMEVRDWLSFFDQYWDNKIDKLKHIVEEE
ncbi:ArsR/SmtB family transcription factor [Halobacillus andaensis]|uniref:ArsR/SmtB family transcription factor n=1 Tax=Halobacillus andaensis TaxID=1176239 RepID=UPI003D7519F3